MISSLDRAQAIVVIARNELTFVPIKHGNSKTAISRATSGAREGQRMKTEATRAGEKSNLNRRTLAIGRCRVNKALRNINASVRAHVALCNENELERERESEKVYRAFL